MSSGIDSGPPDGWSGALRANAEAVVDEVYGGILKRAPAALERRHWADQLRSTGSLKGMLAAAIHGVEFQQLVQPVIASGFDAQADLPHLAKRIAIVSNLQGKPIADAMQVLTARRAPTYYQVTAEGLDPGRIVAVMRELLAAHDSVLTQPVIAQHVLRLAPELGARIELFPSVTFAAYHPDNCGVFQPTSGRPVMGALGPYHSSIAYFAYRAGMDVRETLKHFSGPVYETLRFHDYWGASSQALRREGVRANLPLDELLPQWAGQGCFMHTLNHPRLGVSVDIAKALLRRLGEKILPVEALDYLQDTFAAHVTWPVYPEIAERLGIRGSYLFKPSSVGPVDVCGLRLLDLEQFVSASFEAFDQVDPQDLACDRPFSDRYREVFGDGRARAGDDLLGRQAIAALPRPAADGELLTEALALARIPCDEEQLDRVDTASRNGLAQAVHIADIERPEESTNRPLIPLSDENIAFAEAMGVNPATTPELEAPQRRPRMTPVAAEEYIASLYATVLKRDPYPEEFAHWVATAASLSPEQIYLAFVNSKEYKLQQEPGDIKGIHFDEGAMVVPLPRNESTSEEVRLLIWDLDDTYWRGTLTEGGITEYVREHHDIVIKLAQRGILSSICSKNDEVKVMEILKREGIADYFIFPSISWGPKATRLASIVEAVQLRPATVMFIDDNHLNRAEAVDLIPDLQVEDETFLKRVLSDPRFQGKDDENLTRLAQYKVLEQRKRDEGAAEGNNEEFLRGCDVRVYIEYDVERHIDRAVELINRTNQLNFTKVRLPEDPEKARAELSALLNDEFRQSGLIRAVDKYGDYGFVGFYMVTSGVVDPQNGRLVQRLDHFCFSCRTLGMLVETWVYNHLQRPRIKIVGEVLTDITVDHPIDWIRLAAAGGTGAHTNAAQKVFPEIRVRGGCEANAIAHYLMPYADRITVTGNFHIGYVFCRVNGSTLMLSACGHSNPSLESEADALGIPKNMLVTDYFKSAPAGAAFVFGGQLDRPGSLRYRHNQHGWEICVEPNGLEGVDLVSTAREDILDRVAKLNCTDAVKSDISKVALHIHENYESVAFSQERDLPPAMEEIFSRVPLGSKLVLITDHDRVRGIDGEVVDWPGSAAYHSAITAIAAPHPFVRVVSFRDHIRNDKEINVGGNHYHRLVYLRMAETIIEELKSTPPKTAELGRTASAGPMLRLPRVATSSDGRTILPASLDDATQCNPTHE